MIFEKKHGTANAYNNGCRCDLCKKAKADYRRNSPIKNHGTSWNYDKGCRCDLCREAKNLAKRKVYGRQPRKITTFPEKGTRICYGCHEEKPLDQFARNKNPRVFMGRTNECKVCQRTRNRVVRQTSPVQRFGVYRDNARYRKIPFLLAYEEFLSFWNKPCYYCGDEIVGIGLDRIDSSNPYEISNIVPCCSRCNKAKVVLSQGQFIEMCIKVAKNFKNRVVPPQHR